MSLEAGRFCMNCMSDSESEGVCPVCGHDNANGNHNDLTCLQPGDIVASRYVIGMNKKRGGETTDYIGYDMESQCAVNIKEYFPRTIASRESESGSIIPKSGCGAQYKALMSEYVDLCNAVRRLSVSDAVIPIKHMASGNNTIYAIYKSVDSISLEEYLSTPKLKAAGSKLPVRRALKMFAPLFDTLINMHARGDIHRGISPSTVYIGRDGKLYLWGFALSASRTDGCELDAELFDGYSAPEQYASNGWQGEWTDVYAVAALFYRVVTGTTPLKSTIVSPLRPITPLSDIIEDIPPGVSDAVAEAMQPLKAKRTQTIVAFAAKMAVNENFADTAATAVFEINRAAITPVPKTGKEESIEQNRRKKDSEGGVSVKYVILALFFTVLVLAGSMWFVMTKYFPDLISGSNAVSSRPAQSQSQSSVSSSEDSSESVSSDASKEEDKSIPNFVGKVAETTASDSTYEDRFKFELRHEFDDRYEKGVIFEQAPPAGEIMRNKGTVILFVSKGKLEITMPDLKDKTVEEAMDIFNELGKEYGIDYLSFQSIEKYDSELEGGHIISSIPAADTVFDPKTTQVIVYVALTVEVSETKEVSSSSSKKSGGGMSWENTP